MNPRLTFVAATEAEVRPLWDFFRKNAEHHSLQSFSLHGLQVDFLFTGVGILQTTYTLMDYVSHRHPDLWIQAGIGGDFDQDLEMAQVYQITSEMQPDFGAEAADGHILDAFELGWADPNVFPFAAGRLNCPYEIRPPLLQATGMTTIHAHGNMDQIQRLRNQPHGQIENMEGMPFFYISLLRHIPFLSIRAVSNRVETRNKANWQMEKAIEQLNNTLLQALEASSFHLPKLFSGNQL